MNDTEWTIRETTSIAILISIVFTLALFHNFYSSPRYHGTEIRRTPIEVECVEAHYEEEKQTYFRPPCFYDTYVNRVYVKAKYYVIFEKEYADGEVATDKAEVTEEVYEKIKEELEDDRPEGSEGVLGR